uniref:Actin-associated protein FAM107A n=1 Tax=Ornithorhynchus anatinus TaxID=9258 RepID=A0A6I8P2S6_ORNAN
MAQSLEDRVRLPRKASGLYQAMLIKSASLYSEIQVEQPEIGKTTAHPDCVDRDTELIKPKKLLNPVKASKSHQELHRELLMNHKRGLGLEKKPELQRVLEHRRRNQMIKQKKEEEEAKKRNSPFEQELLKRQQRMNQVEQTSVCFVQRHQGSLYTRRVWGRGRNLARFYRPSQASWGVLFIFTQPKYSFRAFWSGNTSVGLERAEKP